MYLSLVATVKIPLEKFAKCAIEIFEYCDVPNGHTKKNLFWDLFKPLTPDRAQDNSFIRFKFPMPAAVGVINSAVVN